MALLVTVVVADNVEEMRRMASRALERGSDAVELRLDALNCSVQEMTNIASDIPSGRWIATCRSSAEGGFYQDRIEHAVERLLAAGPAGEGFIDIEYAHWSLRGGSPLARQRLAEQSTGVGHSHSLILSHHDLGSKPANLASIVGEMCQVEEAAVVKVAWPAESIFCNFDAFDLIRDSSKEMIAVCMGEAGLMSRVLAGKVGAFASFCASEAGAESAPGQLTLDQMHRCYRFDKITTSTDVYGVVGSPVGHSLGPTVFNELFASSGIDGVYLPLLVEPTYEAFAAFIDKCIECDWLDVRGLSVTLPHKVHALRYLGDRVDPPADLLGAVNTIRFEDGEVWGCNTDCDAAVDAVTTGMECTDEDLEGLPVDVLGAGGASRAIVAGLMDCGCQVSVYNRSPERAQSLANDLGCAVKPWEDRVNAEGKLLINCTSVGMSPEHDASPMPIDSLRNDTVVFDAVYRPQVTRLLRDAQDVGCRTIDGVNMFINQAAMQFEYWTWQSVDRRRLDNIVDDALGEPTEV